jgi:hypothetical protein
MTEEFQPTWNLTTTEFLVVVSVFARTLVVTLNPSVIHKAKTPHLC